MEHERPVAGERVVCGWHQHHRARSAPVKPIIVWVVDQIFRYAFRLHCSPFQCAVCAYDFLLLGGGYFSKLIYLVMAIIKGVEYTVY